MTHASRRSVVSAGLAAAAVATVPTAPASGRAGRGNPLATPDQRRVDRLALAAHARGGLDVAKAAARTAYLTGHGLPPDEEALARLDGAIEELAAGMIMTAANGDPARPRVHWLGSEGHQWFGHTVPGSRWGYDNPDTIYRTIPIDPESQYVVRGRLRGRGCTDLAFSLLSNVVLQTTVGYVDGIRLRRASDPTYTLTIGPRAARGRTNHLRTTADTRQLFIRTTLSDWRREAPDELVVERTKGPAAAPRRTPDDVVADARELLEQAGFAMGGGLLGLKTMTNPVNTMSAPGTTPGALMSQTNAFGHFALADEEALVVRLDPGGAAYTTLPVTDPWMVGVAPGRHQSSLNQHQAMRNDDGTFTYVVSRLDPGVPNWVSTAGRTQGTIMARWQRLGAGTPAIATEVVAFDEVRDVLPAGTPAVSQERRIAALVAREAAYRRRFAAPR